jgi:hypothetical protein
MARYKEIWESYDDTTVIGYLDTEEGGSIPLAPGNRHYRMVQEWIAEGNTPDPAYDFAEQQTAALRDLEGILERKLAEDVLYDTEWVKSDNTAKGDLLFRITASGKNKDVKVKDKDGKLKTVNKNDIDDLLQAIGDRDDAVFDNYELAVAAVEAATDMAGVSAAIATFEAS